MKSQHQLGASIVLVVAGWALGAAASAEQNRAVPIVAPQVSTAGDLQTEIVGSWRGNSIYHHERGYFGTTYLNITFTDYGTYVLEAGPIVDLGSVNRVAIQSRGEYRVLGSGILLSGAENLQNTLHDVVIASDALRFTSTGNTLIGGGVLKRQ